MRIVLDINVLISGLISKASPPGQLLTMWRDRRFVLIVSHSQIERMQDVLNQPRLLQYIDPEEAKTLIADLLEAGVIVEHDPTINLSNDPEDNVILGTAIAGRADLLVSGDKRHVLPLGTVGEIPIVSPRKAIEKILPGSSA